jgi:hypothetical protein
MAYIAPRRSGSWELRESTTTPAGPRSRTLASFRTLTPEVIEHAQRRASRPLDEVEIRRAALRAGAPVAADGASDAAAALLRELERGAEPTPGLVRLLLAALGAGGQVTDAERAAARWLGVPAEQRGEALRDLLLLADRLPIPIRDPRPQFPRLEPVAS